MHEMYCETFSENCDRKKVLSRMSSISARNDEYHHGIGRINWKDDMKPFSSEGEAYDYVKRNLFGDYEQVAVPFLRTEKAEEQVKGHPRLEAAYRKVKEALQKSHDARNEWFHLNENFHFEDAKSAYIECRHCGSKISKKYLRTNYCPVCNSDMRPQSLLDRISAKKKKADDLEKKASSMEKELNKKLKSEKMWLVKIEYHV